MLIGLYLLIRVSRVLLFLPFSLVYLLCIHIIIFLLSVIRTHIQCNLQFSFSLHLLGPSYSTILDLKFVFFQHLCGLLFHCCLRVGFVISTYFCWKNRENGTCGASVGGIYAGDQSAANHCCWLSSCTGKHKFIGKRCKDTSE